MPTYETISDFSYPGARPLYIYVKNAHLDAIKGLTRIRRRMGQAWGRDGPLTKRSAWSSSPDDVRPRTPRSPAEFTAARPRRPEVSRRTRAPMSPAILLLLALGLGLVGWLAARARAWSFRRAAAGSTARRRCRPITPGTSPCGWWCRRCCSRSSGAPSRPQLVAQSVLADRRRRRTCRRSACSARRSSPKRAPVAAGAAPAVFNPAARDLVEPFREAIELLRPDRPRRDAGASRSPAAPGRSCGCKPRFRRAHPGRARR